ncbi:hypothetical protein BCR32DRAFT_296701 [Anaeromyces robustus]|uniref:Small subunit of serine palmitoyltransferase-like protein n=1 Tax=Anaeromyces robustus TaxID=1754192 RepID=A0A1Y1WQV1_9FUNG|nr:hypothetical protein BCR32DRAFT_296701 [Anaeromyces robustus]|eukprot:ORX75765.1 hypothetical protein BCR32DRAFT_296701 [Anaeromyces robustus]
MSTQRNWLSTKIYQFEVTTALYMLDTWEKAIIYTFLIGMISLYIYYIIRTNPFGYQDKILALFSGVRNNEQSEKQQKKE